MEKNVDPDVVMQRIVVGLEDAARAPTRAKWGHVVRCTRVLNAWLRRGGYAPAFIPLVEAIEDCNVERPIPDEVRILLDNLIELCEQAS